MTLRRRIRWPSLFGFGAVALLSCYLCVTAAVFVFVRQYREVPGVRFVDVVVPSRWSSFRAAQGDHLIGLASQLAQRGKVREALAHARSGMVLSPSHRFGRLLLSRLLVLANRPDAAREVLLAGLVYHGSDAAYLGPLVAHLLQRQEDAAVIDLARKLLPTLPAPLPQHRVIALAAATACFFRGHFDAAEDFLHVVPQLAVSVEGRRLLARLDWERGFHDLALLRLRALADEFPNDVALRAEVVARLRQAGLADEARRRSLALQIAEPLLAMPRLALLQIHADAPNPAAVAKEAEDLLRDFRDEPTLIAVAEFAARSGNVPLAQRVRERAQTLSLPQQPHAFLLIEALLAAGDHRAALDEIRVLREHSASETRLQPLFESLQAVAYLALGDRETSRVFLKTFLHQPSLRAEHLVVLANRLVALGGSEAARQVLLRAVAVDPSNQPALTRLVELDLTLNRIDELPAHLQRLTTMRKPSPDLLRVAQHKLGSDLFLFAAERPATLDALRVALAARETKPGRHPVEGRPGN